jgi:hypothetical protein
MRRFKTLTTGMVTVCILLSMLPAWAQNQVDAVYLADLRPIALMGKRVDESMGPRDPLLQKHYRTGAPTFRNQKFERSISIGNAYYHNVPTSAIFLNRDGFDYFETTVGLDDRYVHHKRSSRPRTFTFIVIGDNEELARVPNMKAGDEPVPLRIPIRNVTRLELSFLGSSRGAIGEVWWGDARFVRGNTTGSVPQIVTPRQHEQITGTTSLEWRPVAGATGYLLELQCERLSNPNAPNKPNRFMVVSVLADTTVYHFNVNTMPKGRWRWRVHSLNDTGFLGEMSEWRLFTSQ